MTPLDTIFDKLVSPMLAKFGVTVTIATKAVAAYSPSTDTETLADPQPTQTIKATPPQPYNSHAMDASNVAVADCTIYVAKKDLTVDLKLQKTRVTLPSGKSFMLVGLSPVYSGEVIAAYGLHLRA